MMRNIYKISEQKPVMHTQQMYNPGTPERNVNSNQLIRIVLEGKDPVLRKKAWILLLRTDHTIHTYTNVIDRSPDVEIRINAWEILKQTDVSFSQLLHIIKWSSDEMIRYEAWRKVAGMKLVAPDLINIIRNSKDITICNDAGKMLKAILKCKVEINQDQLIKKIAGAILNDSGSDYLKKESYPLIIACARYFDKQVRRMSKRTNPKIAAYAPLPAYAYLFYESEEKIKIAL